jgi:predicted HicB family RNase H-like nuclease
MIDPNRYSITVRRITIDGDDCFSATVRELPDVSEFAETREEALALALETIAELQKTAADDGKSFPEPVEDQEEDFSGRVTLRMPPSLHRSLAQMAEAEKASLNQYIVLLLAGSTAAHRASVRPWEETFLSKHKQFSSSAMTIIRTHGVIEADAWKTFFSGSAKTQAKEPSKTPNTDEVLATYEKMLNLVRKTDVKEVAVTESSAVDLMTAPANVPLIRKPVQVKTHARK